MATSKTQQDNVQTKEVDESQVVVPSKASPKAKPEKKAVKKTPVKKDKPSKKMTPTSGEDGDVDGGDSDVDVATKEEGEMTTNKPKLSAVPMPLVKKVKEQLDGIQFKNLNELKTVLETFVNVIVETTKDGTSVTLPNYMTFKRVYRNERRHKNPKTKEEIIKPEHYVLSMYVKAQLKKQFEDIPVTDRPSDKKNTATSSEEK